MHDDMNFGKFSHVHILRGSAACWSDKASLAHTLSMGSRSIADWSEIVSLLPCTWYDGHGQKYDC